MVKNPSINAGRREEMWFDPWSGAQQPTPVVLPQESHGQRSLAGYRLWGHKELDTTEMT